jgi:hypothetical protein
MSESTDVPTCQPCAYLQLDFHRDLRLPSIDSRLSQCVSPKVRFHREAILTRLVNSPVSPSSLRSTKVRLLSCPADGGVFLSEAPPPTPRSRDHTDPYPRKRGITSLNITNLRHQSPAPLPALPVKSPARATSSPPPRPTTTSPALSPWPTMSPAPTRAMPGRSKRHVPLSRHIRQGPY